MFELLNAVRRISFKGLYDNNDIWHTSAEGIVQTAMSYFQNLFSTSNPYIPIFILSNIRSSWFFSSTMGRERCHPIVYGSTLWAVDMSFVNQTILVLIPKTIDPTKMRHLQPIDKFYAGNDQPGKMK
ncbi:hypothetical protein GQ457_12G011600 [Hibiscus cannabinus]